jgi:pyruvate,water dikinase
VAGYYNWPLLELDEERDFKEYKVWFLMAHICVPALKPLDLWLLPGLNQYTLPIGAAKLGTPSVIPQDMRVKDGYWYAGPIILTEEENQGRELIFREKMAPWIDDLMGMYHKEVVSPMLREYERLEKADVKKLSSWELLDHFRDVLAVTEKMWLVHDYSLHAVYSVYMLFEDMCRELLGIDGKDPQFKALLMGFETHEWATNREVWRLGSRAKELGLEPLFEATPDDEQLLSKLEQSDAGRKWLEEFHKFIREHGARLLRFFLVSEPTWWEKPSLALPDIRRLMAKGGPFRIDETRKRLTKEREEAERDILARVPYEKREMFEKLMRGAQGCTIYDEDHTYYMEGLGGAYFRRATIEIGNRFAQQGMIDEPGDIYYLLPDEIKMAMIGMHRTPMHKTVRIRKAQHQEFLHTEPAPFIGDPSIMPEVLAKNAFLRMEVGIPVVKPELKADLYGAGSASGVAEGIARVVFTEEDMDKIKEGDILVAPLTHAYWTPVFGIIKAVVTNAGGTLAHTVICAREYGIPAVAGTLEGTYKIKTGDRIRVDGDNCCVYILERAAS